MASGWEHESDLRERLLAEMDWLRSLAQTLLGHDSDAEDLAQDTLEIALRSSPSTDRSLRPWLTRVAKNLASKRRLRTAKRRPAPLAAIVDEIADADAPSDASVAGQEIHGRILEAVLSLPEPGRSTILLRYWEDLPPREIARRMNVPVDTVRTRTRRTIESLRRKLDRICNDRQAWAAPLLAHTKLMSSSSEAKSLVTISARMSRSAALTCMAAIAAALSVTIAWIVLQDPNHGNLRIASNTTSSTVDPVTIPDNREPARMTREQARRFEATLPARSVDQNKFFVTGRLLDANTSKPLTGMRVSVVAPRPFNTPALEPVEPVITGPDGRFKLAWAPDTAERTYYVTCRGRTYAALRAQWSSPEPGTGHDYGDIAMTLGCQVEVSVAEPAASQLFALELNRLRHGSNARKHALSPPRSFQMRRISAGVMRTNLRVTPGDYRFLLIDAKFVLGENQGLSIRDGQLQHQTRLTIHQQSDSISGFIVDQDGRRITKGVAVSYSPSSSNVIHRVRPDGSFRVVRAANDPGHQEVSLIVRAPAYRTTVKATRYKWRTSDVKITLKPLALVDLNVIAIEERGSIVPKIESWLATPPRTTARRFASDNGQSTTCRISSLPQGQHVLWVRSVETPGLISSPQTITVTPSTHDVTVTLRNCIKRRFMVELDAQPVPNVSVDVLILRPAGASNDQAPLCGLSGNGVTLHPKRSFICASGTTDVQGVVELRVPEGLPVAAQVARYTQCSKTFILSQTVSTSDTTKLELDGTRVTGHVIPRSLTDLLARRTKTKSTHLLASFSEASREQGMLVRFARSNTADLRSTLPVHVNRTGRFEVCGLKLGWQRIAVEFAHQDSRGGHLIGRLDCGTAHVSESPAAPIQIDIKQATLIPVECLLNMHGRPAAAVGVRLIRKGKAISRTQDSLRRDTTHFVFNGVTDRHGILRAQLPRGDWFCAVKESSYPPKAIWASDLLRVTTGQRARKSLSFTSTALRLRIVDGKGHPVSKRAVALSDDSLWPVGSYAQQFTGLTDRNGVVEIEHAFSGPAHALVAPSSVQRVSVLQPPKEWQSLPVLLPRDERLVERTVVLRTK